MERKQKSPPKKRQKAETVTAEGPEESDHLTSVTSQKQVSNSTDNADFHPSISSLDVIEVIDVTSGIPNDHSQGEPEHIMHEGFEDITELHEKDTLIWIQKMTFVLLLLMKQL